MKEALVRKDLGKLSILGYSVMGTSATLGVTNVQATCEKIQLNGHLKEDDGRGDLDEDGALERIELPVERVYGEFDEAKKWFDRFYARDVPVCA
ncbi:hypothetical protein FRB95_012725 [Tulasnella sp. JGI-2019a]|nr:hypothetical protein FRB95_012725 [Tulasnella sp. JGI-2019a]